MGAFHIRAVRQACRRVATLPPVQVATPPRRLIQLPKVEQRPLKVYSDHVR